MLIQVFYFSGLTASMVHFDPGDTHFIQPMTAEKPCFGVLFVAGSWRLHNSGVESGPDVLGWHTPNPDGTWPTEFWNSYSADDYCEGGPEGVDWVCCEQNDSGPKTLTFAQVDKSAVLPAGSAMLVCQGPLDVGDTELVAPQFMPSKVYDTMAGQVWVYQDTIEFTACNGVGWGYFPAQTYDRNIMGSGQVLFVK